MKEKKKKKRKYENEYKDKILLYEYSVEAWL